MMIEAGIILVVILVTGAGILAGRNVSSSSDFLTGSGKIPTWLATGGLVGTLIGSQSTLGTAQLAFSFGISAWWFTLGTGLGCLVFALFYARPLRHSGCTTQFQVISREFGSVCESSGSILCTTGTFISVLAQVTACTGFITALYPSVTMLQASVLTVILMCMYIIAGGTWGAGMGGIVKLILLYASCGVCLAVILSDGANIFSRAEEVLASGRLGYSLTHDEFASKYLSMTARGALKDYGSCVSLMLGILSTQTYMQFAVSARTDTEGIKSILWGLILVPPVGVLGVMLGVFMRSGYILQSEVNMLLSLGREVPDMPVIASAIQVFPRFAADHMPPVIAGLILGTLFIAVISGSSGLLLGISAIVTEDILGKVTFTKKHKLLVSRMTIVITLTTAALISCLLPSQAINDLGFLSMTLRASVVFMPLTCALWLGGRVKRCAVLASIILSPLSAIASKVMGLSVEPLFVGMGVSVLCCLLGVRSRR